MRNQLVLAAAVMSLSIAAPAFAQSSPATNPATPSSSQAMPQTANSLPSGDAVQSEPNSAGSADYNNGTSNETAGTIAGAARR